MNNLSNYRSMEPVIKVEHLGKRYWIGAQKRERYTALRDVLTESVKNLFRPPVDRKSETEAHWALRDINFEVEKGEVLGIIGPNGAGKSTLLKILGRITEPTMGRVTIHGRVASLLEVGTGFHPELTGRENIYLSGAILGMHRQEIRQQFDAIVDFSGVESFLDTPVKRYSSGMRVRLGFAVAAHLQPEILLIDEVLAVGDAAFQKKCLGKMDEVAKGGRTVLFVSHDLKAISSLCENTLLLNTGSTIFNGITSKTLEFYQTIIQTNQQKRSSSSILKKAILISSQKEQAECVVGDEIKIQVDIEEKKPLISPVLGIVIRNQEGLALIGVNNKHYGQYFNNQPFSKGLMELTIKSFPPLKPGLYTIDIHIGDWEGDREVCIDCLSFRVRNVEGPYLHFGTQEQLNILQLNDLKWEISEQR